jgi:hypothetical protein
MRIGITGHQRLRDPASWQWVEQEMNQFLGAAPRPLVGVSSLAAGADQLFAKLVLQHGGALEAVVPFAAYDTTFVADGDREEFKRLLTLCARSETLEKRGTDEQAYFAAGKRVIDLSDLVVAVWDGGPARGLGGTADAVKYGSQQRKIIVHLNPITKTHREIPH